MVVSRVLFCMLGGVKGQIECSPSVLQLCRVPHYSLLHEKLFVYLSQHYRNSGDIELKWNICMHLTGASSLFPNSLAAAPVPQNKRSELPSLNPPHRGQLSK